MKTCLVLRTPEVLSIKRPAVLYKNVSISRLVVTPLEPLVAAVSRTQVSESSALYITFKAGEVRGVVYMVKLKRTPLHGGMDIVFHISMLYVNVSNDIGG